MPQHSIRRFVGLPQLRRIAFAALGVLLVRGATAAELDGVVLPDRVAVGGTELRLNGMGWRTYSLLRVRIYAAGLYLENPTHDAAAILASPERKAIEVRFVRDVDADRAKEAWREGFEGNCHAPCHLRPADVAAFLAAVPSMHAGDRSRLTFLPGRLEITLNDRPMGTITDPIFAWAVLATFIGAEPPSESLKSGLLGTRH